MFWVITPLQQPGLLERGQGGVRAVGTLVLERLEAIAVEVPEALGIPAKDIDVRDLHRVHVGPQTGSR